MSDHAVDAMAYALRSLPVRANIERTPAALRDCPRDCGLDCRECVPLHSPEAHDAIAAELVACTLGARRRPELRTDLGGRIVHALQAVVAGVRKALGLTR